MAKGKSQQVALDNVQSIAKSILPVNYYVKLSGGSESFKDTFSSLIFALVLGLVVAYMVLASQFNSFIHPLTVLLGALPFSISGAFIALLISHQSLNLYSMIGLILLMGIVKKNSILLVDFTNQVREEGLSVRDALIKACPIRLRHSDDIGGYRGGRDSRGDRFWTGCGESRTDGDCGHRRCDRFYFLNSLRGAVCVSHFQSIGEQEVRGGALKETDAADGRPTHIRASGLSRTLQINSLAERHSDPGRIF